jgi:GT2 family glycosyltransferase
MRVERTSNKRSDLQAKIDAALAKKPTGAYLQSRGYTPEELDPTTGKRRMRIKGRQPKKSPIRHRPSQIPAGSFVAPASTEIPAPQWFKSTGSVDISIIVPMFNSRDEIKAQIDNWDFSDDGLSKEIIYVDDACPERSYEQVIVSWNEKKPMWDRPIGRILLNEKNAGYAFSCNNGARIATGKYLLFLNADCVVTPHWLKPMVDLIKSNVEIGIVGNLQLRKNSRIIESAGSEWTGDMFDHIGSRRYQGKRLDMPFTLDTLPDDLKIAGERQMVTGSCFLIPKELFEKVGRFDTEYRIGYWEDSDLNMKVRTAGYKIYYEPKSVIYHTPGHSQPAHNQYVNINKQKFHRDWVDTGVLRTLDNKARTQSKNVVVYTAISTGYDSLIDSQHTLGSAKFVAFMEDGAKSQIWDIRHFPKHGSDPNRNAKIFKILSHKYFPEYEYSLWIDGNVRLLLPACDLIGAFLQDADLAAFRHPERNCLYDEAETCRTRGLDDNHTIAAQVNKYRSEGFPAKAGLMECTILLRRHCPAIEKFNEAWWEEICKGSKRDQISFPYVAKKMGLKYVYFPGSLRYNNFLFHKTTNHRRR